MKFPVKIQQVLRLATRISGDTALGLAVGNPKGNRRAIILLLTEHGADMTAETPYEGTIWQLAGRFPESL